MMANQNISFSDEAHLGEGGRLSILCLMTSLLEVFLSSIISYSAGLFSVSSLA
jgi:hypothetical protein